jgi:thioredoxin reductase
MAAVQEDIVIVGAGIVGLTTSLGLHRYPLSLSLSLSLSLCITYMCIYIKV